MKTIQELWPLLEKIEVVQVHEPEIEALYKHCFDFDKPLIVEIGSAHGASSTILAEAAKELGGHLICIDSFPEVYYDETKFGDYARQAFKKNMKEYLDTNVAEFWDMTSDQAIEVIQDRPIDLLFIDADHEYPQVKKDIENYLPLVKSGGIVGFHDYYNVKFGVKTAVDELVTPLWSEPTKYWDLAVFRKP